MDLGPAGELTRQVLAAVREQGRVRVLRWFARGALLARDDVGKMPAWENTELSLHSEVRIVAD